MTATGFTIFPCDHTPTKSQPRRLPMPDQFDPDFPARYRKLPVTVEAIRYTPGTNCIAVAGFLGDSPDDLTCAEEADHEQTQYAIATLEGVMHASPGDYIIRGVHGEHYPCKPDIFEATYERADTPVIPGQNLQALPDDARMDAYYYGFDRTGVGPIDAILSAVATAGKGSHHTESWGDDSGDYYRGRPGLPDADSAVDLIQRTANRSADQIRAAMGALPGQDPGEPYPTAEQIADTLIRYETSGCCQFGRTCGLCDCGRSDSTSEQLAERDAHELGRARAVLALFGNPEHAAEPVKVQPSADDLARAIFHAESEFDPDAPSPYYRTARAVLALFASQPTVEQVKAAALREAAADWSDWDGLSAPEDWLRARADRIEAGR